MLEESEGPPLSFAAGCLPTAAAVSCGSSKRRCEAASQEGGGASSGEETNKELRAAAVVTTGVLPNRRIVAAVDLVSLPRGRRPAAVVGRPRPRAACSSSLDPRGCVLLAAAACPWVVASAPARCRCSTPCLPMLGRRCCCLLLRGCRSARMPPDAHVWHRLPPLLLRSSSAPCQRRPRWLRRKLRLDHVVLPRLLQRLRLRRRRSRGRRCEGGRRLRRRGGRLCCRRHHRRLGNCCSRHRRRLCGRRHSRRHSRRLGHCSRLRSRLGNCTRHHRRLGNCGRHSCRLRHRGRHSRRLARRGSNCHGSRDRGDCCLRCSGHSDSRLCLRLQEPLWRERRVASQRSRRRGHYGRLGRGERHRHRLQRVRHAPARAARLPLRQVVRLGPLRRRRTERPLLHE